jgi:hypothetical protein
VDYVIPIFDYADQMVGHYDLDFVSDEAAIVHAQAMLPPRGGKFEIWQGTRHVTTITSPNRQCTGETIEGSDPRLAVG